DPQLVAVGDRRVEPAGPADALLADEHVDVLAHAALLVHDQIAHRGVHRPQRRQRLADTRRGAGHLNVVGAAGVLAQMPGDVERDRHATSAWLRAWHGVMRCGRPPPSGPVRGPLDAIAPTRAPWCATAPRPCASG